MGNRKLKKEILDLLGKDDFEKAVMTYIANPLSEEDKEKMRAANEMLYIHPEECIDCGACEPECPVEAIYPEDEVPYKWKIYIDKTYKRFNL